MKQIAMLDCVWLICKRAAPRDAWKGATSATSSGELSKQPPTIARWALCLIAAGSDEGAHLRVSEMKSASSHHNGQDASSRACYCCHLHENTGYCTHAVRAEGWGPHHEDTGSWKRMSKAVGDVGEGRGGVKAWYQIGVGNCGDKVIVAVARFGG